MRQSGIDLVMRGASTFFANLGRVQVGYQKAGDAAARLAERVARAAVASDNAARRQVNAANNVAAAQERLKSSAFAVENAELRLAKAMASEKSSAEDIVIAENKLNQAYLQQNTALAALDSAYNNLEIAITQNDAAASKLLDLQDQQVEASQKQSQSILNTVMNFSNLGQKAQQLIGVFTAVTAALGPVGSALAALVGIAGLAIAIFAKITGVFLNLAKTAAGVVVSALKAVANAAQTVFRWFGQLAGGILRSVGDSLKRIFEIFAGLSLYNAIQNIVEAIKNMAAEVFEAVTAFQALEIRLNSILARDYSQAFGTSMQESLGATTAKTRELFNWMRKLAVTSPFDFEEIANVFTMAEAMGITGEMAKRLTAALINFTSAMGLTGEHMWRIVYNFGQMIQRGKLSGEEFRDLARNFVPIDIIMTKLAKDANMTKDAFRELALKGGVPVQKFLEEFVNMTEKDWAEAGLRMSKTFDAVIKNIKEFIRLFVGMDVIKPVLDRITGMMADFLNAMTNNVTMMNSFKLVGQALLQAFNSLIAPVNTVMQAIGKLTGAMDSFTKIYTYVNEGIEGSRHHFIQVNLWAKTLAVNILAVADVIGRAMVFAANKIVEFSNNGSNGLKTFITRAREWGYNLIVTFVNGIAMGLGLLAKVMQMLGKVLESWLKGSSPPKVAENVDQWGADLMNEYLKGFTLADFDMFNDIAGLVESFFKSIEDKIGGENGESLIPRILGARADIAASLAAVRAGTMGVADAIQKMVGSIGEAQPEFRAYISSLFAVADAERRLALASAAVKAAQDAVNAVSSKYEGILKSLRKQLTQVTDYYSEEVRLREINEAMANQLLTDEERERLEMEKRAIELEREIRTVEEQRDAEMAEAEAKLAIAQAAEEAARAELELAKERAEALRDQIEIMIEQNELIKEQIELLKKLAEEADKEDEDNPVEDWLGEADDLFGDLSVLFDEAKKKADEMWAGLEKLFTGLSGDSALGTALANLKAQWEGLAGVWDNLSKEGGVLDRLWDKLNEIWLKIRDFLGIPEDQSFLDWLIGAFEKLLPVAGNFAGWVLTGGKNIIGWFTDLVLIPAGSIWENIGKIVNSLDRLFEIKGIEKGDGSPVLKFLNGFKDAVAWLVALVLNFIDPLNWIAWWIDVFAEALEGLADVQDVFENFVRGVIEISKLASGDSPLENIKAIGAYLITEFPNVLLKATSVFIKFVDDILKEAFHLFYGVTDDKEDGSISKTLNVVNEKTETVLNGKAGVVSKWETSTSAIADGVSTMSDSVIGDFDTTSASMTNMISDFSDVSVPSFVSKASEMQTAAELLQVAIQALADSIWDMVNGIDAASAAGVDLSGLDLPGYATGGMFSAGQPFIAGEKGPELIFPKVPGIVVPDLPKLWQNMMGSANPTMNAQPVIQNIDKSVHINVDANYANQQSEAGIYYDITAALAAIGR